MVIRVATEKARRWGVKWLNASRRLSWVFAGLCRHSSLSVTLVSVHSYRISGKCLFARQSSLPLLCTGSRLCCLGILIHSMARHDLLPYKNALLHLRSGRHAYEEGRQCRKRVDSLLSAEDGVVGAPEKRRGTVVNVTERVERVPHSRRDLLCEHLRQPLGTRTGLQDLIRRIVTPRSAILPCQ
ncbi:hypothetical protein IW261DRAFT_461547 [Armillaria novae-zelandiae]|uniref:Uncharacterized protein n=1 Tax=Armillaria novae-zelandiae TaxID=153914 RepID=A0AA39TAD8_9AGAR|nr:hypothetical protein IW261DRAFT_461547 [Armillaria novae-zelandiae]